MFGKPLVAFFRVQRELWIVSIRTIKLFLFSIIYSTLFELFSILFSGSLSVNQTFLFIFCSCFNLLPIFVHFLFVYIFYPFLLRWIIYNFNFYLFFGLYVLLRGTLYSFLFLFFFFRKLLFPLIFVHLSVLLVLFRKLFF